MADYSTHHQKIGRAGGLTRAALGTNEEGRKKAAQAGRMARYYAQLDDNITDEVERARRAHLLMCADMTLKSKKAAEKRTKRQAA